MSQRAKVREIEIREITPEAVSAAVRSGARVDLLDRGRHVGSIVPDVQRAADMADVTEVAGMLARHVPPSLREPLSRAEIGAAVAARHKSVR